MSAAHLFNAIFNAGDLLLLVLAPLVVGLVLRGRYPEHRDGWKAGLEKTSNIALYIAIAAGVAVNWKSIALVAGFMDTVVPFVIAAEIGRFVSRRQPKPAPGARAAAGAPSAATTPSQAT
jgi:predicted Na+-dependent transporter